MPATLLAVKHSEPVWRPWRLQCQRRIPAGILCWLQDEGSLTRRVIAHCADRFSVCVKSQSWGRALASERQLLGMRPAAAALVREVELHCGSQSWVFARTLIPASSLQGGARRLAYLGDKPLGAVLFADPTVRRGLTQVARLLPGHVLFDGASAGLDPVPAGLWARRVLFHMEGKPLLVNEVFLPNLPD